MKPNAGTHLGVKTEQTKPYFVWNKNPSVQKLLDVVVHILANEYVRAVKENPTLFSGKGGAK